MKRILGMLCAALCTIFMGSLSVQAGTVSEPTVSLDVEIEILYDQSLKAVDLVNQERKQKGLEPLAVDTELTDSAIQRAAEQVIAASHSRPNGQTISDINPRNDWENLSYDASSSPEAFVQGIFSDSLHYSPCVNPDYQSVGIICAHYDDGFYWVQLFSESESVSQKIPDGNQIVQRKVEILSRQFRNLGFYKYQASNKTYTLEYGYDDTQPVRINNHKLSSERMGYVMPPSDMAFSSSDPTIFTVDGTGMIHPQNAGTATLTMTYRADPSITSTQAVTIKPLELGFGGKDPSSVISEIPDQIYTGREICPKVTVKDRNGRTLIEGKDYTLRYEDNVEGNQWGYASVWVDGIGNYSRYAYAEFKIVKKATGSTPTPTPAPTQKPGGGGTQTKPTTAPVKPTSTPKPTQKPSGMQERNFTLKLSKTTFTYNGKYQKPSVVVYANGKRVSSQYYNLLFYRNRNAGTAYVTAAGKGTYKNWYGDTTYKIVKSKFSKVKLSKSSYTYNGKSQKPKIKVYVGKKKLSSKYYSISYKNNKNPGYAKVTVKGKGKYKYYSSTSVTYRIVPKKQSVTKLKSKKKRTVIMTWKKDSKVSGYQIQISRKKSFKGSTTKTYGIPKKSTSKMTIKNVKSRKVYYVKVRSYKISNGKKIYGSWSNIKKVKIR